MFFAHGHDPKLNYELVQYMYDRSNESGSWIDETTGCIKLKNYLDANDVYDEHNEFPMPLYNEMLPKEWLNPLVFLYKTKISQPTLADTKDIVRYIVEIYAAWSYIMYFLKPGARPDVTDIQSVECNYTRALLCTHFCAESPICVTVCRPHRCA